MIIVLMAMIATSFITKIIYPSIQLVLRKGLLILSVTFENPYKVSVVIEPLTFLVTTIATMGRKLI